MAVTARIRPPLPFISAANFKTARASSVRPTWRQHTRQSAALSKDAAQQGTATVAISVVLPQATRPTHLAQPVGALGKPFENNQAEDLKDQYHHWEIEVRTVILLPPTH